MEHKEFIFEALRSDYEAVRNILDRHIERGKISVKLESEHIRDKYWVTTFMVTGTDTACEIVRSELEKDWLIF